VRSQKQKDKSLAGPHFEETKMILYRAHLEQIMRHLSAWRQIETSTSPAWTLTAQTKKIHRKRSRVATAKSQGDYNFGERVKNLNMQLSKQPEQNLIEHIHAKKVQNLSM
jgi:hypothetical protein